jgi:hypothetical protein
MARDQSISKRIASDRGGAGFWAFIASLPAVAAIVGLLYVGVRIVTDADAEDFEGPAGFIWIGAIALFAFLFYVVGRWTYDSVHAALTPQRVQAMWLRRFQAESGGAFRTSRVIDRLSRHGVAALTLQDRDVQLSFEQRRNRLAPVFWLLFIPVGLLIGYALWNGWQDAQADIMNLPPAQDLRTGIGQAIGAALGVAIIAILLIIGFFASILLTMIAVMLIAAIIGPIGAALSKNRDDFKSLPRLLERIKRGRRRGASIVRVSDANWREAVTSSLAAVDVAIIDLSNVSEHVAWEIGEAARACSASGLIFICRDDAELSDAAKLAVRNALGREMIGIVHYPARRGASDKAFARDLRQQIYNAADLRQATRSA